MELVPIVLFVYNRPWHAEQTLHSLELNELAKESVLYIYADGPKENALKSELEKIEETRKAIRKKQWCKEVYIIESERNKGLAKSIINGVTEQINKHTKIIVLEDDLQLSKGFLKYMNDALAFYENEEKVMHISGYMFPVKAKLPETFFYNATSCWGWGTWKRAWQHFNVNANDLYVQLLKKNRMADFDFNINFGFLNQLIANKEGKLNTWAVKWYTSVFLLDGLSLHPNHSLVNNIGHDNSGDNCETSKIFNWDVLANTIKVSSVKLKEYSLARKEMILFNNRPPEISTYAQIKDRVNQLTSKIKQLFGIKKIK